MSLTSLGKRGANGENANASGTSNTPPLESSLILTGQERAQLAECEDILLKGLGTFFEVGRALLRIREGRLYRTTHSDFSTYCHERWGICRSYACRVMGAAERLQLLPPNGTVPLPTNEFQVRPFLALEPEAFPKAWEKAVRKAKDGKVTADLARSLIAELKPDIHKPTKSRIKQRPTGQLWRALRLVTEARSELENNEREHVLALLDEIESVLLGGP